MSSDVLDDIGNSLSILEQIAYSNTGKPAGFAPRKQPGDGLTDDEFAERMRHLDQLGLEKYEHEREMSYFMFQPLMQGARRYLPAAWRK